MLRDKIMLKNTIPRITILTMCVKLKSNNTIFFIRFLLLLNRMSVRSKIKVISYAFAIIK